MSGRKTAWPESHLQLLSKVHKLDIKTPALQAQIAVQLLCCGTSK
jgi:hypothetical protein